MTKTKLAEEIEKWVWSGRARPFFTQSQLNDLATHLKTVGYCLPTDMEVNKNIVTLAILSCQTERDDVHYVDTIATALAKSEGIVRRKK